MRATIVCFLVLVLAGCATSSSQPSSPDDGPDESGTSESVEGESADQESPEPESPEEPPPKYEAEEDTSPQPAPVIEARKVAATEVTVGEPTTEAVLNILEVSKHSSTLDVPDPAPRALVTSFDLAYATGRNTGGHFRSGVGVEPYASEVQQTAPELERHEARQYELWFGEPFRTTLEAYQDAYGGVLRAERFTVDGEEVQLVVFARSQKVEWKVSIYDERFDYTAVAFAVDGAVPEPLWALDLSALFEPYREIDDIQLGSDGRLFLNSNYQSYAREVDGETAYFYAIHPGQAEVLWRAGPLVSRSEFLVMDDVVLTGYGFTREPDYLYVLDRESGARLDREKIRTAHRRMRPAEEGIQVVAYDALIYVEVKGK